MTFFYQPKGKFGKLVVFKTSNYEHTLLQLETLSFGAMNQLLVQNRVLLMKELTIKSISQLLQGVQMIE